VPSPIAKITDALLQLQKLRVSQSKTRRKREKELSAGEQKLADQRLKFLEKKLKATQAQLKEVSTKRTKAAEADVDFRPGEPLHEQAGRIAKQKRLGKARTGTKAAVRILREREQEFKRLGGSEADAKRLKSSQLKARIVSMKGEAKKKAADEKSLKARRVKAATAGLPFRESDTDLSLAKRIGGRKRLTTARGKAQASIRKLKEREEEFKRGGGDPRVAETMTSSQLRSGIKRQKKVRSDADKLAKAKASHIKEVDGLISTDKKTGEQFVNLTEPRRVHLRKRQERLFPGDPVPRSLWAPEEDRTLEDKIAALGPRPRDRGGLGRLLANVPGFGGGELAEADIQQYDLAVEEITRTHVVAPATGIAPTQPGPAQTPTGRQPKRLLGRKGTARQANGKTARGSKPLVRRTKQDRSSGPGAGQPLKAPAEMTDQEILNALGVR